MALIEGDYSLEESAVIGALNNRGKQRITVAQNGDEIIGLLTSDGSLDYDIQLNAKPPSLNEQ